jgi:hypothetical protein
MRVLSLVSLIDEVGFVSSSPDAEYAARFAECVDRSDRARCALSLVLQQTERRTGYLYACSPEGLVLFGGIPEDEPSRELDDWVRQWYAAIVVHARPPGGELATETLEGATDTGSGSSTNSNTFSADPPNARFRTAAGTDYEALPLMAADVWERRMLGVFLLELSAEPRMLPSRSLLLQIADALELHGDLL